MNRAILSQTILSTAKSKSNNFLHGVVVSLFSVFSDIIMQPKNGGWGWIVASENNKKVPASPHPSPPLSQRFKQTPTHLALDPVGVKLYRHDTGLNSETFTIFKISKISIVL